MADLSDWQPEGPNAAADTGLLRDAARWRGRRVGLYGGSFNPGHAGHLHVALAALKRLKLDAVWLMVSPGNPLKDSLEMAPFNARLESARELADAHPKLHASDIEHRLGSRFTAETIDLLQVRLPKTRFLWLMGADNMADFHHWADWHRIVLKAPIAIFDRPEYSMRGLSGRFAHRFARARVRAWQLGTHQPPAWAFVTIPRHPASATEIRQGLGGGWALHGQMSDQQ